MKVSLTNLPNNLELLNMDSETRKKLKSEFKVYLTKFLIAQIKDICEFRKSDTTFQRWVDPKKIPKTLFSQEI